MANLPPRICVVGSANIDLTFRTPRLPKPGETLAGQSFHLGYGGKGANQAVMAARLGASVSLIAKVGRDVFGDGMLRNCRDQGIDTRFIHLDEQRPSGVAAIVVDDQAQNSILLVPGANDGLSPSDVQAAAPAITGAAIVIGQLEVPLETTLAAFRLAKAMGVRTIFNPAPASALPEEMFRLTDVCVLNETECEVLTGQPVATVDDAAAAASLILQRGPRAAIVTLGGQGAVLVQARVVDHFPAVKVEAVDPTGAGDAFIGSLAVFLAEGQVMTEAVRRANAVAALTVTCLGAQMAFPTRKEMDAWLLGQGGA